MNDRRLSLNVDHNLTTLKTVGMSVVDLRVNPKGKRDRQLVYGEHFHVLETNQGWSYGFAQKDGYTGYVLSSQLNEPQAPTHFVTARSSHIYPEPNFKSEEIMPLSFGARLTVVGEQGEFAELSSGQFLPQMHIDPIDHLFDDPIEVADRFLGVPYLWGGNSIWGLDCSGLVQAALNACGVECAGDADLQEASVGEIIGDNVRCERGDLFFWKGHVALVRDENTLLHANAHHMLVVNEPLSDAINRINAQGDGEVTSRRRPAYANLK